MDYISTRVFDGKRIIPKTLASKYPSIRGRASFWFWAEKANQTYGTRPWKDLVQREKDEWYDYCFSSESAGFCP